jgi:hypothetical protein
MTTLLSDHDMEGQAALLFSTLRSLGWADLLDIRLARFLDVDLPEASTDRAVWRYAQARQMLLLTGNRSMTGPDSLEETIRQENTPTSLPVLTVSVVERLEETRYREACADRIAEILVDLDLYQGTGRLYIPSPFR